MEFHHYNTKQQAYNDCSHYGEIGRYHSVTTRFMALSEGEDSLVWKTLYHCQNTKLGIYQRTKRTAQNSERIL